MSDEDRNIKYLFEPRSITVIGASKEKGKIGYAVLNNIQSGGFAGKVYPVNPAGGIILGIESYKTITDIEDDIDVACITIPAKFCFDAVKQCADKGVKYCIVITSGFSEIGKLREEREMADYANARGMRILGPNVFGVYSAHSRLNTTFVAGVIPAGHLAMITQSGALGLTLIGQATIDNIGMSAIVSVGNKSDIDEADLLEYIVNDDSSRVILMYLEGVRNGEKFMRAIKKTTSKKPVVIIKAGRSEKGSRAAASHTGSLAGSDDVFDDLIRQCGALRAENLKEAFNWSTLLANNPLPKGENTVIVTNGGGAGVMATDACEKYNVTLYDNPERLKTIFGHTVPAFGSTKNPIDLTGSAAGKEYTDAFNAAAAEDNIDSIIGIFCETAIMSADLLEEGIAGSYEKIKATGKTIVFSLMGGEATADYGRAARKRQIPVSDEVYDAVSSLGAACRYKKYLDEQREASDIIVDPDFDLAAIASIVENAKKQGRYFLLAPEAQRIMDMAGINIPKSIPAKTIKDAVRAANTIGYPVVMKVVSRDIIHKSDAGGLALDLENDKEIIDAYGAIMESCKAYAPSAVIEGVDISEMVGQGIELIVGARIDHTFGPIAMIGLGGIYVEVMKDVSFRSLPLDKTEIIRMIKEIRSYPLLLGVRGEEMKDIEAVIAAIMKVGAIIRHCKGISDIEINPLVVYEQGLGVKAVDIRIILSKE
jgi:acetate---CoA ligase (ADP-forming)